MDRNPPTSKILVFGPEIEPKDSFSPEYKALTLGSLSCSLLGPIMADTAKIVHLSPKIWSFTLHKVENGNKGPKMS